VVAAAFMVTAANGNNQNKSTDPAKKA